MKINSLILFIILFLMAACEYSRDEVYYVDVPPADDEEIVFNLADFPTGAIIYIYKRTKLYYQLTLPEGEVLKKQFSLNGREIYPMDGYLEIEPTDNIRTTKKLTVDIEIDSDSENIAAKLGLENKIAKFEYILIFIPDAVLHLRNIVHRNKDGYFELIWDKPDFDECTIDRYRITCYNNNKAYIKEINDPNKTGFIDSLAVFGALYYNIETFFKGFTDPCVDIYTAEIGFPKNSIRFEYTGVNSGKISWPQNEYKSKYAFAIGYYGDIVYEGEENYFEIDDLVKFTKDKTLVFPFAHAGDWVELYVVPSNVNEVKKGQYSSIHHDMLYSPSLVTLGIDRNRFQLFTDTQQDKLFIKNGKEFWIYDRSDLVLLDHAIVDAMSSPWDSRVICSEKSSTIFIAFQEWIELVSYDFKSHEKIQFDTEEKLNYYNAFLGTNDVVYIRPIVDMIPEGFPEVEGKLYAYSLDTRELINFITFPDKWDNIVISRDGKYVAVFNNRKVLVYQFSEDEFTLLYREDFPGYGGTWDSKGIYFNPKYSDLMIITLGSILQEVYVVNVKDTTKSAKKRGGLRCIDPYTGNVVIIDGFQCAVYDQTLTKQLFEQERTDVNYIFSNYFFTSGWGDSSPLYYLDITNYLEK